MQLRMVMSRFLPALVLAAVWGAPAAAEERCYLPYTEFEEQIPHFDVEKCPGDRLGVEEGFCRLGLEGSDVLIYQFRYGEEADCLVAIERYSFRDFSQRFGITYSAEE